MKGLLELLKLNEINCVYLLNVSRLVVSRNSVLKYTTLGEVHVLKLTTRVQFYGFFRCFSKHCYVFLIEKNLCVVIIALT